MRPHHVAGSIYNAMGDNQVKVVCGAAWGKVSMVTFPGICRNHAPGFCIDGEGFSYIFGEHT